MNRQKKKQRAYQNMGNTTPPTTPVTDVNKPDEVASNQTQTNNETNQSGKISKEKYLAKWTEPSIIISIIIALFTLLLFWEAKVSSNAAIKSTSIAESVLTETQKEFELGNKPFLQFTEFEIDTSYGVGKPIKIIFQLDDLGKYPVKVIDTKGMMNIKISPPPFNTVDEKSNHLVGVINRYIVNGTPLKSHFISDPLTDSEFVKLEKGTYSIYCTGYIRYKNLITDSIGIYKYQIRLIQNPYHREFIINENTNE